MKKIVLILVTAFFSCKNNGESFSRHDITIANSLLLSATSQTKFVEGKGIDSYIAYLINEKNDTFYIEYGDRGIINSLHISGPPIFQLSQKEAILKTTGKEPSPEDVLFSQYPEEDKEQNIFDRNFFLYDTVSNIVVKVVQPKRIGDGITGIYIPELKDGKSFSIYASNLDSTSHKEALRMFETIRYK